MKTLKEGDYVFVSEHCEKTKGMFGLSGKMKQYFGTIQIVDNNPCNCGCIRLKKSGSCAWHEDDLTLITEPDKDIKQTIKPIIFDSSQLVGENNDN